MTNVDPGSDKPVTYWQAVNAALADALEADPAVAFFGEDVAAPGGVLGVTRGLQKRFGPERVWDTPISEAALVGTALGASLAGMRPVLELMFMDFALVAADQLLNHVAKTPFLIGPEARMPLVVRTQQGVTTGSSAQHSQSLESVFAHVPGFDVALPATVSDAYWLLRDAIDSDRPSLVIEHRSLYREMGTIDSQERRSPTGRARVMRTGDDVTLVAWSAAVGWAMEVADRLSERGIAAEVIDLRTLVPLDLETVVASARRTRHVTVLQEAVRTGGFGAEIAASVSAAAFDELDAPVLRFGAASSPAPAAPGLQTSYLPNLSSVVDAVAASRCNPGA